MPLVELYVQVLPFHQLSRCICQPINTSFKPLQSNIIPLFNWTAELRPMQCMLHRMIPYRSHLIHKQMFNRKKSTVKVFINFILPLYLQALCYSQEVAYFL